jgi:hypothetical protein
VEANSISIAFRSFSINTAPMTFSDLVEEVRHRPVEEMEELKHVLDHELIEAERDRLYMEHLESVAEWESGKLKPTSDIDEFMHSLDEGRPGNG